MITEWSRDQKEIPQGSFLQYPIDSADKANNDF